MKIYLENATLISVFKDIDGENRLTGKVLHGTVLNDETNNHQMGKVIFTSTVSKNDVFEFVDRNKIVYLLQQEPKTFETTFDEFMVMKSVMYSPEEYVEVVQAVIESRGDSLSDNRSIEQSLGTLLVKDRGNIDLMLVEDSVNIISDEFDKSSVENLVKVALAEHDERTPVYLRSKMVADVDSWVLAESDKLFNKYKEEVDKFGVQSADHWLEKAESDEDDFITNHLYLLDYWVCYSELKMFKDDTINIVERVLEYQESI